jgi:hypothetical protein
MEKTKSLMSRAYETPEIEEIMVETSPVMEGTNTGPGGGGMDNPSPEDPD